MPARPEAAPAHTASALSEGALAHLWEGQRFPPQALTTRGGERLRVVYRGRPGGRAGPDFRDAIIAAPWGLLQGDVELHVRASDFRRHGHHRDPAYDRLALHVVFWDDEGQDTLLASGRRVPLAALTPWLEGRAREIERWLARPARWREPCRSAPERLGPAAVAAALDRLGDIRFRQKAAALGRALRDQSPDDALWRGLLEALGYGGSREAFRLLGERLPWREMARPLAAVPVGERLPLARRLLLAAAGLEAGGDAPPLPWRRGTRPGNDPRRRLEGAAHLAARFAGAGPLAALLAPLRQGAKEGLRPLLAALTVPALIGPGRAQEVLANVVLPLAAALGERGLEAAAEALYRRLPLPARYGAVRHLHQAVGGAVAVNARRQQGMLYLLRQYCSRGGCGPCPLS